MSKLVLAAVIATIAAVLFARRQPGTSRRSLRELGDVAISKRLDDQKVDERDGFTLFPFDHTHPFLMGSSRPVTERLTIGVWTDATRQRAHDATITDAADRTSKIAWRTDGDVQLGEGTHEVNASTHPAWIVARDVPAEGLTIAYMVWQKDASLDRAKRAVADVAASFRRAKPNAEYLATARDRPAAERSARRTGMQRDLAARGVQVTVDGPLVEAKDGTLYALWTHDRYGAAILSLHYLGSLPRKERFIALNPAPPSKIGSIPGVIWFGRDDGTWVHHETHDDVEFPARIDSLIGARHKGDPNRAHFYAYEMQFVDDADMPAISFDWFERATAWMITRFPTGAIVE